MSDWLNFAGVPNGKVVVLLPGKNFCAATCRF
jgi:hypothetical protein